ncbi:hypothetical protein J3R80_01810 [Aliiroseovarius sp. Z3]|uniref:hypothetical protein n=1 Tax=Aliiroseovarius sp. Z3 TaxID=2811402 RepID=UPI0023B2C4DF|nr:hypothetical protein [Aliiroseovarius sp. Z3]MDE9449203.1 hypothetical protein [Aliiroseovarius sp. Z3]
MKPILAMIGAVGLYGGSIIAALAETDKNACYGETLDVVLQVYEPTDDNDGEVQFALPNPASWNAQLRENGIWLRDLRCQEEPMEIGEVYGSGMRGKFQGAIGFKPGDLEMVRSLELDGGISREAMEEGTFRTLERFKDRMAGIPFGFKRLESKTGQLFEEYDDRTFASGLIQYPEHYTSPVGNPILARCSGFGYCKISYMFSDRLLVDYEFRSSVDYEKRWIAQDQAVRKLIESWMVEPAPNN